MLHGRTSEQAAVESLLADAQDGRSGALVIRGEMGIGKSTLLDYAEQVAGSFRVLRAVGIETETTMPFAGLHLLFGRVIGRIDSLPDPEAHALNVALGRVTGSGVDRFQVGLAVLGLLAELAEQGPLLCLVDDAHWFDRGSAEALRFAARRIEAEGIVLIFAAREADAPSFPAQGLPELCLDRLPTMEAEDLLVESARDLSLPVRTQILTEAQGNPLALLELANAHREGRSTAYPQWAGALSAHSRVQQTFADRVGELPADTQDVLLVIAADLTGDPAVVLAAADRLGATMAALEPAERERLVRPVDGRLDFRHPLVRAAVYQTAPLSRRLAVHQALAAVYAERDNICLRAWHLAAATTGQDEDVAAALETAAENDRMLGGYDVVAAAYQRAAELSPRPADRSRRLVAAAEAAVDSGQLDLAANLADSAEVDAADPVVAGRIAMTRATLADERGRPLAANRILVAAAELVAPHAPESAAYMLLWAVDTAWLAGEFGTMGDTLARAKALGVEGAGRVSVLTRLADSLNQPDGAGLGTATKALSELVGECGRDSNAADREDPPSPRVMATVAAWHLLLGDHDTAHRLALDLERRARMLGAIGRLPHALELLARTQLWLGRNHDALASATEGLRIAEDIGQVRSVSSLAAVMAYLAALTGDQDACARHAADAAAGDVRSSSVRAACAQALSDLGVGRFDAALVRLATIMKGTNLLEALPAVPDFVEAAVRLDRPGEAAKAADWLSTWADRTGQPWTRAVALRCRAQLSTAADDEVARLFQAALEQHQQGSPRPFERARTELLYGEWLRRARRRPEARTQLVSALDVFERLNADPWAARARSELRATGERQIAANSGPDPIGALTPQELKVVRLAATGLSNRDIGVQLFLSPRTVGYHLYKAYPKLGVASRAELASLGVLS